MNMKERMVAGLPYKGWQGDLKELFIKARYLQNEYNNSGPADFDNRTRILKQLLGSMGENTYIEPPFRCDYGFNISVGKNFYSNFNLVILDPAPVTIGDNVFIAPNVAIYTAGHPIHHEMRNTGYEYGIEVKIGNNVWIGGNSVINPGITIGDNTVIGSGSVVTKDIQANVVAAGNPCRVIREITDEDKKYYFKDRVFDIEV